MTVKPSNQPRQVLQVMISSTFTDLKEHRAALIENINKFKLHPNAMEHDDARLTDVIESSLQKVRDSHAYIGLIGLKYGQIQDCPIRNPDGISLSEMEFNEAQRLGRPILLFIMDDSHPLTKDDIEKDTDREKKLNAFRARAKQHNPNSRVDRVYAVFDSLASFKDKIGASLVELTKHLDAAAYEDEKPADAALGGPASAPRTRPGEPAHAARFRGYPFRGLADFNYAHQYLFFGRSAEIAEIVRRIGDEINPRLLVIHGDSGVGKSSLLKAGLLPRLIKENALGYSKSWRHVVFEPTGISNDPFLELSSAIKSGDDHGLVEELPKNLARSLFGLCTSNKSDDMLRPEIEALILEPLLSGAPEEAELILAINQLEELLNVAEPLKLAFLRLIAIMAESPRARLFCTMRRDAYTELLSFEALRKILSDRVNSGYPLYPPNRDQLEDMIREPARVAHVTLERPLVTRILDDAMQTKEGALPLVSYALQTLRLESGEDILTLKAYEDLGGLTGAVSKLAAKATSAVGPEQLDVLFERLVLIRNGVLSRRYASRAELDALGVPRTLIDELDRNRLLHATVLDGRPAVQLAHEVLFHAWKDLDDWVKKSEARMKMRDEIERDAQAWVDGGRRHRFVKLRGQRLDEVRATAAADSTFIGDNPRIREYMDAADAQGQREKLIASVNGGYLSGIVQSIRAGGRLELEDRHEDPGGVRPQFWAAVTGDDRADPFGKRTPAPAKSGEAPQVSSVFDDPKLVNSTAGRRTGVGHLVALCGHFDLLKRLVALEPGIARQATEGGSTPLTAAALGGHLEIVKFLVEECGLDPIATDQSGSSPILWAHQQNHHEIVSYLGKRGATLDLSMEDGWNKLTEAARSGDARAVREILDQGIAPDLSTKAAITPLMVACQNGRREVAELLLERGAAPNHQMTNGASAAHWAVFQSDTALFDLLGENGCDLNIRDHEGATPLLCAASEGKADHVERLLQLGADPAICRWDGNSPLTIAAALGFDRVVQALLAAADDVNRADAWGWTALHYVADDGDVTTAAALLARPDLDLNCRERTNRTPLMFAAGKGHDGVVKLLVDVGANRRLIDRAGVDALAAAIKANCLPVIRQLLRNELALDRAYRSNSDSTQPQHLAAGSSAAALRRTAASALPNYPNPDHLGFAVAEGNTRIVQTLLMAGADPARRDDLGDTALHHAARLGRDEIAKLLLRAGALLDVRDREGRTPMDVAIEIGNASIVECLISEGAQEPEIWSRPRVSDLANFLSFVTVPEDVGAWLRDQLQAQPGFVLRSEQMRLRAAKLPFYDDVYLVAAEDSNRRGPREQFALCRFGDDVIMLDWTNEPIYAATGRWGIDLANDETVRTYSLFFFHFVRGQRRYNFVEHVDDIRWKEAATDQIRQSAGEKLLRLQVAGRSEDGQIRLKGSVVFMNVLFHTTVVVASAPTKFFDGEGDGEMLSAGELRLTDVTRQLDNLPIEVDGPPGVFG